MTSPSAINPVVDGVMALVPLPDGWTLDGSCSRPAKYQSNVVYGWPGPESFTEEGTSDGASDEVDFTITVAAALGTSEENSQVRLRTSSDDLDAVTAGLVDAVRTHRRNGDLWIDLRVLRIDPGSRTTFDQRIATVTLAGHRIVSP